VSSKTPGRQSRSYAAERAAVAGTAAPLAGSVPWLASLAGADLLRLRAAVAPTDSPAGALGAASLAPLGPGARLAVRLIDALLTLRRAEADVSGSQGGRP
jgi:hypothetical protein